MEKIFRKSRRKRIGLPSRLEKDPVGWRVRRGTNGAFERGSKLWCPSGGNGYVECLASGARRASHIFLCSRDLEAAVSTLGSLDCTLSHLACGYPSMLVSTFSLSFTFSSLHGPFCSGSSLCCFFYARLEEIGMFCACVPC